MTSTTGSITPSCTSKRNAGPWSGSRVLRNCARVLVVALLLATGAHAAVAGGITPVSVELRPSGKNYQPVADFSVTLNPVVERALTHGVPLYFVGEFSLIHHRWYWLNDVVARNALTLRLSYNALTRQYRVSYGAIYQNFANLDDALHLLGHQAFDPFPMDAVHAGIPYVVSVRLHLDLAQLPKPLQINALVNNDWEMDSGWRRWTVKLPAAPNPAKPISLEFK